MKNELSVKGEQKWGAEGYKEETKKSEKSNFINTQSISSSSNMFTGMENNGYSNSSSNNERNNRRKKNEEDLNPENQAKKNLMKGLFGGLGGDDVEEKPKKTQNIPKKDNNNLFSGNQINNNKGINLFEGMIKNNDNIKSNNNQINNNNNQNNKGNIDLLGFGESNQDNNINNNNQGSIDLLGDIFGGGNSQNNFSNNNQNQNNNLFDDLSNNNNNNFTSNNDIFGNLNTENMNNSNNIPFTPYNINTDEFGELWGSYPDENYYEIKVNISSPQQFHDIIKSKANFAAVDIINNEAISAANYKNQVTLVHATIEPNSITLLVKCQNQALNQEVATYIMGIFK
jgi:hypothetical protein